jgi:chromosome transmission fidelity protein 1
MQAKAALLDDEGTDLSEFLPDAAAQQGPNDTASPGAKRAAPDAGGYSSSSSEDEAPAADAEAEVAAAAAERRQPQVIFCSRTHSQLSQFVGELHRTRFARSILLVAIASRKALCVNDEVR